MILSALIMDFWLFSLFVHLLFYLSQIFRCKMLFVQKHAHTTVRWTHVINKCLHCDYSEKKLCWCLFGYLWLNRLSRNYNDETWLIFFVGVDCWHGINNDYLVSWPQNLHASPIRCQCSSENNAKDAPLHCLLN